MAYDEVLADRLRDVLAGEELTEQKMFGGLAFLANGNMAVAASGQGGLLLRCDPDETARLVEDEHVDRFEMRGRKMDGWLRVDGEAVADDEALASWARVGLDYARSLPAKS
jgi:hypothetical protein